MPAVILSVLERFLTLGSEVTTFHLSFSDIETMLNDYLHVFGEADQKNHPNKFALEQGVKVPGCKLVVSFVKNKEYLQNEPIADMYDAHMRLGLVSHRHCLPSELRITAKELMPKLKNLAWFSGGVMEIDEWNSDPFRNQSLLAEDKIPPYVWAMPLNEKVRIANPYMIRFGAYIGDDTIIMHYGFINFDAGIKKGMVEGRIPGGVLVGQSTDIGAGSGSLGRMSGGNKRLISIGDNCLIEANTEVGIPLGNNCRVQMGTCFHGNMPVTEIDQKGNSIGEVKAEKFAGMDNLTFRTNSITGAIEVLHKPNEIGLNEVLHQNVTT